MAWALSLDARTHQTVKGLTTPGEVTGHARGQLELEVLEQRAQSSVLLGRLVLDGAQPGAIDGPALAPTFLVELDDSCQLQAFARSPQTGRDIARQQQLLLWEASFSTTPTTAWHGQDGTGVLEGEVVATTGEVRRTAGHYASRWEHGLAEGLTVNAELVARVTAGPLFDSLVARTRVAQGADESTSEFSLTRAAPTRPFSAAERLASAYVWENLLPVRAHQDLITHQTTRADLERRAKVASLTPTQAVDAFVDRVKRHVGTQATWPELASYFEAHPEAVRPTIARYQAGELPREAAGDFFLALGKSQTPEAREALLDIDRTPSAAPMDHVRAEFALILRPDVGAAYARELSGAIAQHAAGASANETFLAGQGLLALSTMSGSRDDAAVSQVARETITQTLQSQPLESDVAHVALRALGNTGEVGLLPLARRSLDSPDRMVRKAAAHAFTRMPAAGSDGLEVEWLQRETDPFVRKDAWLVFQLQHANRGEGASRLLVTQALKDLKTEKSAFTRRSMVLLVAQSSVANEPDVRQALIAQAKAERGQRGSLINLFATILTRDERAEVLK
jgi:hypothetical protein